MCCWGPENDHTCHYAGSLWRLKVMLEVQRPKNYIRLAMKCTAVGAVGLFTMLVRFSGLYWHIVITDFMDIEQTLHGN
jgi:hypothetical protein